MPAEFEGLKAIVTGGASGIGAATVAHRLRLGEQDGPEGNASFRSVKDVEVKV